MAMCHSFVTEHCIDSFARKMDPRENKAPLQQQKVILKFIHIKDGAWKEIDYAEKEMFSPSDAPQGNSALL